MVFDFETGGKDCRKNLALEFAAIWVDGYDFREIDRYEALILPYDDNLTIEAAALSVNGIDIEDIAENGVELDIVVRNIIKKTEDCNEGKMRGKKTICVGQNATFDIGFLQQIFKNQKQDLSKIFTGDKDFYGNFQPVYFDTLYMARNKYGQDLERTSFSLGDLAKYEQIDLVDAHRGMPDVETTLAIFVKYMTAIRSGSEDDAGVYNFRDNFKFQF